MSIDCARPVVSATRQQSTRVSLVPKCKKLSSGKFRSFVHSEKPFGADQERQCGRSQEAVLLVPFRWFSSWWTQKFKVSATEVQTLSSCLHSLVFHPCCFFELFGFVCCVQYSAKAQYEINKWIRTPFQKSQCDQMHGMQEYIPSIHKWSRPLLGLHVFRTQKFEFGVFGVYSSKSPCISPILFSPIFMHTKEKKSLQSNSENQNNALFEQMDPVLNGIWLKNEFLRVQKLWKMAWNIQKCKIKAKRKKIYILGSEKIFSCK